MIRWRVGPGAPGRAGAASGEQVLRAPRNPVQRPAVAAGGDLPVRFRRLLQCAVLGERHDAVEPAAVALQAVQVDTRQFERRHLAAFHQARERRHRQQRKTAGIGWRRGKVGPLHPQVGVRRGGSRGLVVAAVRVKGKGGRDVRTDGELAQLVVPPPVARHVQAQQVTLGGAELQAGQRRGALDRIFGVDRAGLRGFAGGRPDAGREAGRRGPQEVATTKPERPRAWPNWNHGGTSRQDGAQRWAPSGRRRQPTRAARPAPAPGRRPRRPAARCAPATDPSRRRAPRSPPSLRRRSAE